MRVAVKCYSDEETEANETLFLSHSDFEVRYATAGFTERHTLILSFTEAFIK